MITAGIDVGSLATKAVVLAHGSVAGWAVEATGDSSRESAGRALTRALAHAGVERSRVGTIVATGAGSKDVDLAPEKATEVLCAARGARFVYPEARGLIEIGAESSRALRLDERGRIVDFALNAKCAAGTGVFLDVIAKLMGIAVEEMGPLAARSQADVTIDSTCVVFAESEVVSQIHRQTPKEDILKGVHRSIAVRLHGLASRVGLDGTDVAIGGVSLNTGVIACLEEMLQEKLVVPESPQIVPALGAALIARERSGTP